MLESSLSTHISVEEQKKTDQILIRQFLDSNWDSYKVVKRL